LSARPWLFWQNLGPDLGEYFENLGLVGPISLDHLVGICHEGKIFMASKEFFMGGHVSNPVEIPCPIISLNDLGYSFHFLIFFQVA